VSRRGRRSSPGAPGTTTVGCTRPTTTCRQSSGNADTGSPTRQHHRWRITTVSGPRGEVQAPWCYRIADHPQA
jgi:hypothetical protein